MGRTLLLEKGEIVLSEDRITIRDNAKREKMMNIISSSMWTLFGILSILRFIKTEDQFLLWSGILIGPSHFVILILTLFTTSKNEVRLEEIETANFKERFGRTFLDLKLKDGTKRRIIKIEPILNELEEYFNEKKLIAQ